MLNQSVSIHFSSSSLPFRNSDPGPFIRHSRLPQTAVRAFALIARRVHYSLSCFFLGIDNSHLNNLSALWPLRSKICELSALQSSLEYRGRPFRRLAFGIECFIPPDRLVGPTQRSRFGAFFFPVSQALCPFGRIKSAFVQVVRSLPRGMELSISGQCECSLYSS